MSCPVARWAAIAPDAPALVFGDRRWTYAQLHRDVGAWASLLKSGGIGPGARVAVFSKNQPAVVAAFHACARLGAIYVPINARLTAHEVAAQDERLKPALWLFDRTLAANVPVTASRHSLSDSPPPDAPSSDAELPPPQMVRAILFTSGTTGAQRMVQLTYANFDASTGASGENLGRDRDQRWLGCLPLFHVGGLTMAHKCATWGATLVLQPGFDPQAVWTALHDERITHLSVVATGLRALLDHKDSNAPKSLRAVLVGGGPVPAHLMKRARDRGFPVLQTYGLTEACSQVATEPRVNADGMTAGVPLPGCELRIVGGELEVRGPNVTTGYLGDDAANRERFTEDGWFRTGDLGAIDDRGRLIVFARRTDLIVSGGENVYPAEVEAVLASHPAVDEVAVVAVDDARWGQVPAALVVPKTSSNAVVAQVLSAWCKERLADFKVPKWFHPVERLPKTGSGKVDRAQVRALVQKVFEPGEKR